MCGSYGFSVKNAKDVYERFDTYSELSNYFSSSVQMTEEC